MNGFSYFCTISYFLLLSNGVLQVKGGNDHKKTYSCSPSSCGHLHDIHYPFRLNTDPPQCGLTRFELLCNANEPYLHWQSGEFYVKSISYSDQKINVIDPALANGTCNPATYTLGTDLLFFDGPFVRCYELESGFEDPPRAFFVSCSRKIVKSTYYGCRTENKSLMYVINGHDRSIDLEPSCRRLSSTFISKSIGDMKSSEEVFDTLAKGFNLCWFKKSFWESLRYCFQEAIRLPDDDLDFIAGHWFSFLLKVLDGDLYFTTCMSENLSALHYNDKGTWSKFALFSAAIITVILFLQVSFASVLMLLCRLIFMPCIFFFFLAHKYWRAKNLIDDVEKFLRNQKTLAVMRFSYTDIIAITNHFRDKLGAGGFGSVFKGTILNNRHIAIKMLQSSRLHGEEFINEVSALGRIHHKNIVRLVGYCSEESKKALVYEYMPNGSLDKHIFGGKSKAPSFSWYKIKEIALGIAQGINYLHRECEMQILHFDIKPHNVLLDYNFVPKISDFGLAKLYPREVNIVSLSIARGTAGYIAPELLSRNFGGVSDKSDVYSYGMLLLEMAGGRRNWSPQPDNRSRDYYPSWMYDQLLKWQDQEINLHIDEIEANLCKIGLWCIQMKPSDRPSMGQVVEMLEGDISGSYNLQMPPRPFCSPPATKSFGFSDFGSIQMSMISEQQEDDHVSGDA